MNNLIKQIVESKFNFNIDNLDSENQNSLSKSSSISKSLKLAYEDLYLVDLGLPSKTIWCKYNLGVNFNQLSTSKDWYGNYYAWGELDPKAFYIWNNYSHGKAHNELYKYCTLHAYDFRYSSTYTNPPIDGLYELELKDDAAYLNLHIGNSKFKIPSKKQFEELLDYTTAKYIENYLGVDRLNGMIFVSENNNKELFIPMAGYYDDLALIGNNEIANVWTSSVKTDLPDHSRYLLIDSDGIGIYSNPRYCGCTIRPVLYL